MAPRKPDDKGDPSVLEELARHEASGGDVAAVIALAGYVGPSPRDGVVRLFPSLGDLSVSIDIPASDIVATRDAPTATMPLGGTVVWVPRTTEVTFHRTRTVATTARQVSGFFGAGSILEPNTDRGDRLNIQIGPATHKKGVPPVYVPPTTCVSKECGGSSHCLTPCVCE